MLPNIDYVDVEVLGGAVPAGRDGAAGGPGPQRVPALLPRQAHRPPLVHPAHHQQRH